MYGHELILDLRDCDSATMTRNIIGRFMGDACAAMNVEACDLHFWDDEGVPPSECQTDPKKKGVTAVQFLLASSIVVHTLEMRREVYLNAFSCDVFDEDAVANLALRSFGGRIISQRLLPRGLPDETLNAHPDDFGMIAFGMERVEKVCEWAIARIDGDGQVDDGPGLRFDYQDICEDVASLGRDLRKFGLVPAL